MFRVDQKPVGIDRDPNSAARKSRAAKKNRVARVGKKKVANGKNFVRRQKVEDRILDLTRVEDRRFGSDRGSLLDEQEASTLEDLPKVVAKLCKARSRSIASRLAICTRSRNRV